MARRSIFVAIAATCRGARSRGCAGRHGAERFLASRRRLDDAGHDHVDTADDVATQRVFRAAGACSHAAHGGRDQVATPTPQPLAAPTRRYRHAAATARGATTSRTTTLGALQQHRRRGRPPRSIRRPPDAVTPSGAPNFLRGTVKVTSAALTPARASPRTLCRRGTGACATRRPPSSPLGHHRLADGTYRRLQRRRPTAPSNAPLGRRRGRSSTTPRRRRRSSLPPRERSWAAPRSP